MKQRNKFLFAFLLCFLCGCSIRIWDGNSSSGNISTGSIPSVPIEDSSLPSSTMEDDIWTKEYDYQLQCAENYEERYTYTNFHLFAGEKEIPIFNCKTNFSNTWNGEAPQRMNNAVATFQLEGTVKLDLIANFKLNGKCKISPLKEEVPFRLEESKVEFIISQPGQYTIELSNSRTLHLFVNGWKQYEDLRNAPNVMYFGPGVHHAQNDNRIGSDHCIYLSSNTTVFLDEGAIIEGGFRANSASNITIGGYGIVSGATFERSVSAGKVFVPFDFNQCQSLHIYGISTLDPAGWCYNLYFSRDIEIDNIKIISSRSNGDGISVQSCQDVEVRSCFVRAWDDALVVKNYPLWSNRNIEGTTRNIRFQNCIIWTDLAQSMEIGFETVGEIMEEITFEDITVIHNFHKAVISIHNGNNANITKVTFRNITVEDASMGKGDGKNVLIELTCEFSSTWSTQHKVTSLGSIDGVTIENVNVLSANQPAISIRGSVDQRDGYQNSTHYVSNVTLSNIVIEGQKVDASYAHYEETYAKNIIFQ